MWHLGDPRSRWQLGLPLVLPLVLASGPLPSPLKWNVCPLSSIPSTTLGKEVKRRRKRRREAGFNVTGVIVSVIAKARCQLGNEPCELPLQFWTWVEGHRLEGWKPELDETLLPISRTYWCKQLCSWNTDIFLIYILCVCVLFFKSCL